MSVPYDRVFARLGEGRPSVVAFTLGNKKSGTVKDLNRRILDETASATAAALERGPALTGEGENRIFAEPVMPKDRLIIFGAGHIAVPLAAFARAVEFDIVVVDDRPSFADPPRFGNNAAVMCEYFSESFSRLALRETDYAVIITRGHRHDLECLRSVLSELELRYVGMIGSKSRVALAREKLLEEGIPKERLDRVCSPIGLSIGAVSPAEIAVSITAELIAYRRLKSDGTKKTFSTGLDAEAIEELARSDAGPRAAVTVMAAEGSVPRGAGSKLIVYPGGRLVGSIGGGCSESDAIKLALDIIGSGTWLLRDIDLSGSAAESEGMVCGGALRILVEDMS